MPDRGNHDAVVGRDALDALDQLHQPGARHRDVVDHDPAATGAHVAVDLRLLDAGVAVLIEGINEARKEKIILSLQDISKPAQQVLEMARVDKLFQVSGKNYLPPQQ